MKHIAPNKSPNPSELNLAELSLAELQQALHSALLGDSSAISQHIAADLPLSQSVALNSYRRNSLGAALQALAAAYPVCLALLGESCFNQVGRDHIQRRPLRNNDLNRYGADFSQSIVELQAQQEPLAALAYLPELASLERLIHLAYYADNRPGFDSTAFAALTPERQQQVVLQLAPDVGLLASVHPVAAIWEMHQDQGQNQSKTEMSISAGQYYYLVQRQPTHQQRGSQPFESKPFETKPFETRPFEISVTAIDETHYRLLKDIECGQTLAELSLQHTEQLTQLGEMIKQTTITGFAETANETLNPEFFSHAG